MGWSCSQVAGEVIEKLIVNAMKETQYQNAYKYKDKIYIFEINQKKEYPDGSITGKISKVLINPQTKAEHIKRAGSFRINGKTGEIKGGYGIKELRYK